MRNYAALIMCTALCALTAGCVDTVVDARGGLYGIPGAEGGYAGRATRANTGTSVANILENYAPPDPDLVPIEGEPLRYRDAAGDLYIECRSGQHLIYHITEMIRNRERDLLFDWIISDRAKYAYRERFIEPMEAVNYLIENEKDVVDLFLLMPAGENTAGVIMTTPEAGVIRLTPDIGQRYGRTKLSTLEFTVENGRCKLLNIY